MPNDPNDPRLHQTGLYFALFREVNLELLATTRLGPRSSSGLLAQR